MLKLEKRIKTLAQWMSEARHLVVFTGAGISTESGLPDFRGPDGLWTRQAKGLPSPKFDWSKVKPNQNHLAIVELQNLGKLAFLISQNVDNFHLESGIRPDLIAELHGNRTKGNVVNFGQPLPVKELKNSEWHSRQSDLFIVVGSSLVVYPAADCPKIALDSGAKLVIINQGETPFDRVCHLRFKEKISEVLLPAIAQLKELMKNRR